MVGIMLRFMYGFVLSVLEGRGLGYFVRSRDVTKDDVGGPCVGIRIEGINNASEIDDMQLNYSAPICIRFCYNIIFPPSIHKKLTMEFKNSCNLRVINFNL